MTLATTDDFQARLGRDLTDDETARAEALLADVSAAVKIRTTQTFELAETTVRLRIRRDGVRLPQSPVHGVTAVTDIDGNDISFEWDGLDRVALTNRTLAVDFADICTPVTVVDVTYEHGYEDVPEAIIGVVCSIALRAFGVAPTDAAYSQESIDGYSYTIGSAGAAGPFGVLPYEAEILDAYRKPPQTIPVTM